MKIQTNAFTRKRPSFLSLAGGVVTAAAAAMIFGIISVDARPPGGGGRGADAGEEGQRPGPPPAEDVAQRIMDEFDADGNNELSMDELVASIQAQQARHRGPRPSAEEDGDERRPPRRGRRPADAEGGR